MWYLKKQMDKLRIWRNIWVTLSIKFHVIRKTQNINESIHRIAVQLLSLDNGCLIPGHSLIKWIAFTGKHWGPYVLTINHSSMNSLIRMAPLRFIKKNAQSLEIEIYKYLRGLSPLILGEVFKVIETIPYDLRMRNELYARNQKSKISTETISFLPPKIWALIPKNIKDSSSLPGFKKKIIKWKPNCSCRLCKTYLQHVGFIWLNSSPTFLVFNSF